MIEIVIREGLEEAIDSSDIETILQDFLTHLFEGERSLSVYLTDDEEIRQLNLKQRTRSDLACRNRSQQVLPKLLWRCESLLSRSGWIGEWPQKRPLGSSQAGPRRHR